jgi:acetylornithine deacetylase/succinyl-diaminopimelate desuccinylase-like protein
MRISGVAWLFALLAASRQGKRISPAAEAAHSFRVTHDTEIVREFADLLSISNLASDTPNIEKNAAAVAALYEKRGLSVRLLRVEGAPPAVFASRDVAGAKETVTFYAHYDGQPVDPKQWNGDPFRAILRDRPLEEGGREIGWPRGAEKWNPEWRIYARSAGDDKAPIIGFLAALDALKSARIQPSVNLRFFFDGEEEAGSPHIGEILAKYADIVKTDAWILCDGPVHQSRRPQVFFGARGTSDLDITVYGPNHGLHSGHYGNWAPNPISELAALLDSLRDTEGRILVPGFLDDVRPLSQRERRALSEIPRMDEELKKEFDLGRSEGRGAPLVELLQNPAINFRGISSGHVGAQASNTINPEASASIDFRLVPDQTPERVRDLVEEHIRRQGFFIVRGAPDQETRRSHPKIARLDWKLFYPAARTPMDDPVGRRVVDLLEAAGKPLVKVPMLGGSIPMYLFRGKQNTPVVGLPIANHDDNQHAADENLRLQNLWDGIEAYAVLFSGL